MREIYYEAQKDNTRRLFAEEQMEYDCKMHFHRAFELSYVLEGGVSLYDG